MVTFVFFVFVLLRKEKREHTTPTPFLTHANTEWRGVGAKHCTCMPTLSHASHILQILQSAAVAQRNRKRRCTFWADGIEAEAVKQKSLGVKQTKRC